jgi:hypothetical protein
MYEFTEFLGWCEKIQCTDEMCRECSKKERELFIYIAYKHIPCMMPIVMHKTIKLHAQMSISDKLNHNHALSQERLERMSRKCISLLSTTGTERLQLHSIKKY